MIKKLLQSWADIEGNVNTTESILRWIKKLNEETKVDIRECSINDDVMWFYDDYNGEILNRKRSFFSIKGMRYFRNNVFVNEQPIIIQPEIGYLGIICKEIKGVLNFLMQAKIEPGNINKVQISPTVQATKSNFTRAHGGKLPSYFTYFENLNKYRVLYDSIQSEQGSRFYKKRNRNIIIVVDDEIELLPNFMWMTLGQIKSLMDIENIVNMDTRSVLAGIPFSMADYSEIELEEIELFFNDKSLFYSMFRQNLLNFLPEILQKLNNYKMFNDVTVTTIPLNQLIHWEINEYGVTCREQADFMIRYYDIEIYGREVQRWIQPLFKAVGEAVLGLITSKDGGAREFLVKIEPEIGAFDKVEIGPSVHWESSHYLYDDDAVGQVFRKHLELKKGVMCDVVLSEEGGRFFHEKNRNVIIEIEKRELKELPEEYLWVDYATINYLLQASNYLNIQLRNLLSLLKL